MTNTFLRASDLQIGDRVDVLVNQTDPTPRAFGSAVVQNIDRETGQVTFFRPYASTADFIYTGGVICTVGTETFSVNRDSDNRYLLLDRRDPEAGRKASKELKALAFAALDAGDIVTAKRILNGIL